MPLTIASLINFIPTNLWRPLKKFVTKNRLVVFDLPFKMSTKYTTGLLIVLMCLSFANQFVRNIEISCSTNGLRGSGNSQYGSTNNGDDKELNDFCWNYETFLVAKALEPNMRGMVTYPGISGYNKGRDEVLTQRYYKYVWLILGKLSVIAFMPYFFWKARAVKKIESLVEIAESQDYSVEDQRLNYFLETIGFNESFAWFYMGCKILATLSPFVQWYYLYGFLGQRYKYYGINVLIHLLDDSESWPNPMDVLFPKMAKCEWSRYGFGGDIEIKSADCQLPMNNITLWSFFLYWIWIAVVFAVNFLSLLYLFCHIFPCCRRYKYRKLVGAACREDVEKLLNFDVPVWNGKKVKKQYAKSKVILVNMSFGDLLVLSFIKKNTEEWEFRDFIRKIATTQNTIIQLRPVSVPKSILKDQNERSIVIQNHENEFENAIVIQNPAVGFKQSIINQGSYIKHPSDNVYQSAPTDFDRNESSFPAPQEHEPFKASAPVKIDRKNLKKVSASAEKDSKETIDNWWNIPESSNPTQQDPYYDDGDDNW